MFDRKQLDCRSVKTEARRAERWAELFGLEPDCEGAGSENSSVYYTLVERDEAGDAVDFHHLRVSRHEPNYSRRSDADIMLYVGAGIFNGEDDTEVWQGYAEKLAEISGWEGVWPAAVRRFFTLREKRQIEAQLARRLAAEEEAKRREAQRQRTRETLLNRCRASGIGPIRLANLLAVEPSAAGGPCGLAAQVQTWFKGEEPAAAVALLLGA